MIKYKTNYLNILYKSYFVVLSIILVSKGGIYDTRLDIQGVLISFIKSLLHQGV